jgi:catechol 2,3-dioxygenase-like lactoylglutathione lyase family enzyme
LAARPTGVAEYEQSNEEDSMLGDKSVAATVAVSDMKRARDFYERVLGLTVTQDLGDAIVYGSGTSAMFVYQSDFAGTNKATSATWGVGDDFDHVVQALREKGVTFEHYDDLPGTSRDGDVHSFADSGMRAVWFKDPDDNILNVGNGPA